MNEDGLAGKEVGVRSAEQLGQQAAQPSLRRICGEGTEGDPLDHGSLVRRHDEKGRVRFAGLGSRRREHGVIHEGAQQGPTPPGHGPHRYEFHVYALDVPELPGDANTTAALLRFMMIGHVLAQGKLTGIYER